MLEVLLEEQIVARSRRMGQRREGQGPRGMLEGLLEGQMVVRRHQRDPRREGQ